MLRLIPVYVSSFFLSLNFGALLYISSSLLGEFFGKDYIALFFLAGAVLNTLFFLVSPYLIRRFSKETLLFAFLVMTTCATFFSALAWNATMVAIAYVAYSGALSMVYYCFDIFVEELSEDKHTGELRGIYLTFVNAGIAVGPLLLSLLVKEDLFRQIYLAATALMLMPLLLTFPLLFKRAKTHLPPETLGLPFMRWWKSRNVRAVTLAKLILETFFALMVIYTPLYLREVLHFDWAQLGIIFTVALLPFVLFEWPAGELADRFFGEKEMMSLGFFITGVTLLVMPFLSRSFSAWLIILFLSRVGASLVEIMTESYFFKKIHATDTGFLSIFRLTRSVSIAIGSVIGVLSLYFFSFEKIFFVVAVIIFLGLKESLYIKDTR